MKTLLSKILPLMAGAFLLACYPYGPDYIEDLDIIFTTYDEEYQFDSKQTYSRPDKIVIDVEIENGDTTYIYMKDQFANQIFEAIDRNMTNNGWSRININQGPDLTLTPAVTKSTNYYYSYWYDWWYGGWYPGWGWYYPPTYVGSQTVGTLIIAMADPNIGQDNPINQSEAVWLSVTNGIAEGRNVERRVLESIDQSFAQSPYLNIQ
jgi:hypothetical protein